MADASISAIGKYEIIELIGEGAMGVVYKARDSMLDRTVAIKVMNDSIAGQPNLRQRFLREAQSAGSLQHPNVVTIHDLGEIDGHLFIAMEFIEGVDLEHLITASPPLSLQGSLEIIIDVLHGLGYAHKRGIVHRDIKPSNIRVGEDGRAKIMDFGVAHLLSSTMTSTGAILGTPSYMAPEQIAEGKTSAATDIFTVGGVLYEVLTMMKPFHGSTVQNLLFKIVTENPRPVSELVPGLPRALDHIVRKAMAKEPFERYRNALDMANDLTGVRSTLGGTAVPLSASVANAIGQSKKNAGIGTRTIAYAVGGVLAAAVLIAIGWMQFWLSDSTELNAGDTRAPNVVSAPPSVVRHAGRPVTSKTGTLSPSAPKQARPPVIAANSQNSGRISAGSPQVVIPDPLAAAKTNTPAIPPPFVSVCGGNPRCDQVSTFVATATDLRESVIGGGGNQTRVVGLTVRFRNTTGGPLILGYVSGSGVVTDDRGNRYTTNNVRGLGVVGAGPIDAKFVLRPGESGDARFEFMWAPRGTIFGTRYVVELSVREIEPLAGNQWRLGQEHSLHFSGFGEQGVAAAPQ
jgi:serine/threonine protein kinase